MSRARPVDEQDLVDVRPSTIHGTGAFASRAVGADTYVLDYLGEIISWDEAQARYHARGGDPGALTYYFSRSDGTVLDGAVGGNAARFLNHSCEPTCAASEVEGRIEIRTIEALAPDAELTLDYALIVDEPDDPDLRALYRCRCGAPMCRGTMLAARDDDRID